MVLKLIIKMFWENNMSAVCSCMEVLSLHFIESEMLPDQENIQINNDMHVEHLDCFNLYALRVILNKSF